MPADLVLTHSIDVSPHGIPRAIAADTHGITVALQEGTALQLTWTGHVRSAPQLCPPPSHATSTSSNAALADTAASHITCIVADPDSLDAALVYSDGSAAHCICDVSAPAPLMHAVHARWLLGPGGGALCGAIGARAQSIALGCDDGITRIWAVAGSGSDAEPRELSLADWGHGVESTGAVACVVWTPDSEALAVGYERQGFAVWTASGCRVMSSLRHVPQSALHPDAFSAFGRGGVAAIAWDASALRLVACEHGQPGQLLEMQFVRPAGVLSHLALPGERRGPEVHGGGCGDEVHVLQADDRLLFVTETLQRPHAAAVSGRGGLSVDHALLPHSYAAACWPVRMVSVAAGALDIAVAGSRGFLLHDRRTGRWRMFGDVRQERAFTALRLAWLSGAVVACQQAAPPEARGDGDGGTPAAAVGDTCKVVVYSRFFLDASTVLAEMPLLQVPTAMDTLQGHLLLAFPPLQLLQVRVEVHGRIRPSHTPAATLTPIRELNLLSLPRPIIATALIANRFFPAGSFANLLDATAPERTMSLHRSSTRLSGDPMSPRDTHSTALPGRDSMEHGSSGRPPPDGDAGQRGSLDVLADEWRPAAPTHCLLLRCGGLLTLVDLDSGIETHLFEEVESVWLCPWLSEGPFRSTSALWGTSGAFNSSQEAPPSSPTHLPPADAAMLARSGTLSPRTTCRASTLRRGGAGTRIEMPWWVYSSRGMHLLFPSTLARLPAGGSALAARAAAAGAPHMHLDQELQFDREVFPIGVSLADAAIIGMSQRLHRAPYAAPRPAPRTLKAIEHADGRPGVRPEQPHTFCLVPVPQSQPVLPCLLRRQLQHAHFRSARRLARLHQHGPHFSRSLEWLLFTSLDFDYSEGDVESVASGAVDDEEDGGSPAVRPALLRAAFDLIRCFPQWRDVVVNVSRKTDAVMWPLLFAVVGKPSTLLQQLLRSGQVHTASCLLVVVDSVEGPDAAHALALALVEAAMQLFLADLAAELLRFLDPGGDTFLDPPGAPPGAARDPAWQHGAGSRTSEGPVGNTPDTARPAAATGAAAASAPDQQLLAERSRLLQSEASAADTGAPITPPTLGTPPAVGQRSWMSFFFGEPVAQRGSSEGVAPAVNGSREHAQHKPQGGADASPVQPPGGPAAGLSSEAHEAGDVGEPGNEGGGGEDGRPSDGRPSDGSAAVATAARRLIAEYAWTWLAGGHLLRLADLQRAMALVPCSLAALMQTFPAGEPAGFSADDVIAAIRAVRLEVPVDEQPGLLSTAHDLLLLFHYIFAPPWRLAMAVCLDQQTHLQQMRQRAPKVWSEVRAHIAADESLRDLAAVMQT